jgi:hypothetical protein
MKMQKQLLDLAVPSTAEKAVNDGFIKAGNTLKMDPFYRTRASGSFFNAIQKGTFKSELKSAAERMYKGTPYEKMKGVVDMGANIIQSAAAPLFEHYIPAVKRGAYAAAMEDWVKSNPNATAKEMADASIKLSDSIDNRFGELVQDNLFWNKALKQVAQIMLVSPTWTLGTIREIGGGLKDIPGSLKGIVEGKGITDRTAYVAALATQVALKNAIYTYIKNGVIPAAQTGDPSKLTDPNAIPHGKDFMAGRTGGTDIASGKPERVITPGYEKDVYAFGYDFPHNVLQESANKLGFGPTSAGELIQNKDYNVWFFDLRV